jgi:hypothetical protein
LAGTLDDFRFGQTFNLGQFTAIVNSISGVNKFQQRDGVVGAATKAYTDSLQAFGTQTASLGSASPTGSAGVLDGVVSFGGLFYTGGVEQSQATAIYNLYKSTLGQGLGLP